MPRPPAPADPTRHEEPAEGSRDAVQHELKRTGKRGKQKAASGGDETDMDRKLDRAVEMTFPASDPPAVGRPTGTEEIDQPQERQAPRISKGDIDRASGGTAGGGASGKGAELAPGDDAPAGTPGTGEDLCPMCSGRGRIKDGVCPNCRGSGKVIKGIGGA